MTAVIHPARQLPYAVLVAGLTEAMGRGHVRATHKDGATLYCYTRDCVYDRAWTDITTLARGLILDHAAGQVLATPFPKFFNLGERQEFLPDLPFESFDKLDGSLITAYWHRDRWRCATKGSLDSDQARWAEGRLNKVDLSSLQPGATYNFEAIYAANRIVIHYDWEGLCLLGGYTAEGFEYSYDQLQAIRERFGWRLAERFEYASVSHLLAESKRWPSQVEGRVLRFANGLRLKVKGDDYCAVHRLISGCTPLALWDSMMRGDDLRAMRRQLPEEFWSDFDKITGILAVRLATFLHQVDTAVESVAWDADVTDRELGMTLQKRFPGPWADFVFHRRKKGTLLPPVDRNPPDGSEIKVPSIRRAVFNFVRPTANHLPGYVPSASVHRVQEEAL